MKSRLFITILAIAVFFTTAIPVGAWTTNNLMWYTSFTGDAWWNYDFRSHGTYESNNVDWPVTAIYFGNATIPKIKDMLWGNASQDGTMYLYLEDSGYSYHDSDQGSKSAALFAWHVRLYAASGYSSYHPSLGYYVLGTTHYDSVTSHGWSEDAAYEITAELANTVGWNNVWRDYWWMFNEEQYRWASPVEYVQNNGYVDFVYIP